MRRSLEIPVRYDTNDFVVRLQDSITADSIFRICEEIDLAVNYYQYNSVIIEIDSLGGDTSYLEYYFLKLQGWQQIGVEISTIALTIAASASAYILACGNVGRRTAYPAARIVFHYGSSSSRSNQLFTKDDLERRARRLGEIDAQFETFVVDNVIDALRSDGHLQYPIMPPGIHDDAKVILTGVWKEMGVVPRDISTKRTTEMTQIVKQAVAAVHKSGRELTPLVAQSFLFIDSVSSIVRGATERRIDAR